MKISEIRVEQFRAIRSCHICVYSETALVGQNSSGKSSVLCALNAFFNFSNEQSSFEQGRHSFQKTSTSIVDVSFSEVPSECNIPRTCNASDDIRIRLRYKKVAIWEYQTDSRWNSLQSEPSAELSRFIRYVYIPLRRDHQISSWDEHGILKDVVTAWVERHTSKRDSISPKVADVSRYIRRNVFDKIGGDIRQLAPIEGNLRFLLDYDHSPDYNFLIKNLKIRVNEGSTTVDLQDCGSGTQSMTAFALYSYLAELQGTTYVLGIEEPEQNLHPQAQRALVAKIRNLPLQALFTTHSTVVLDELRHEEVVLCRRSSSQTRGVEIKTTQLSDSFWRDKNMDKERYYQFHSRHNSEFFFADFIIVVESPIDAQVIRELIRVSGNDIDTSAISIISVDGVGSMLYVYNLLKELGLSFATVVDKDYFLPYLNDQLECSRDARGFPRYKRELKKGTILDIVMHSNDSERDLLCKNMISNHSRAMDILEEHRIFCFKWSLEVDLVNASNARALLCEQLNISSGCETKAILIEKKKMLKKLDTLIPVVRKLSTRSLPNSYKRLRKSLPGLFRTARP